VFRALFKGIAFQDNSLLNIQKSIIPSKNSFLNKFSALEQDPATGTQQTLYHFPNSLEKIIIHSVKTQILKIFLSENVVASFDLKSISLADEIRRSWNQNLPEDIWSRDNTSLSQLPGKTSMVHRCQTVQVDVIQRCEKLHTMIPSHLESK